LKRREACWGADGKGGYQNKHNNLDPSLVDFIAKFVGFTWIMIKGYDKQREPGNFKILRTRTCVPDMTINNILSNCGHISNKAQYHFTPGADGSIHKPIGCSAVYLHDECATFLHLHFLFIEPCLNFHFCSRFTGPWDQDYIAAVGADKSYIRMPPPDIQ
jgi:hypothetical protein